MSHEPEHANQPILFEVQNGVARITFNRPETGNTLDMASAKALLSIAVRCENAASVRAVLLTAAGENFSAGGDLKTFVALGDKLPDYLREVTSIVHMATSRLARLRAPLVAAVQGVAAGGGFSLVCMSDIVIAAESARFAASFTRTGLVPDGGLTYFLPRLVGSRRAAELTLLNRVIPARQAWEWGIVTEVVANAEVFSRATQIAGALAAGPTCAFGATKRLLQSGWTESLETQLESESRAMADAARTEDVREGVAAFLEKRKPKFEGR